MKLLIFIFLLFSSLVHAAPCSVAGELVHWQADYCMNRSETDDFEAASVQRCMSKEQKRGQADSCTAKIEYKQKLCVLAVKSGFQSSVTACMKNRQFSGPTVRNGGV